jgi:hypothetical protein
MPDWIVSLLAGAALLAFLYFAFWRGLRNKPEDRPDTSLHNWTGGGQGPTAGGD